MHRIPTTSPPSAAFGRAQARLTEWRSRRDDALALSDELDEAALASAAPFLQELKDRFDRAENQLLRMSQVETAWGSARSAVERSLSELEDAWRSVERALKPEQVCGPNTPTWPC